jgi:hypothetical protein
MLTAGVFVLLLSGTAAIGDALTPLVGPYLKIHEALASDTLKDVSAEAERLAAEATRAKAAGVAAAARELGRAGEIEAARTAFGTLTEALRAHLKGHEADLDASVRLAYCPMVDKHWLQTGSRIANPYYGKSMLRCGEFRSLR